MFRFTFNEALEMFHQLLEFFLTNFCYAFLNFELMPVMKKINKQPKKKDIDIYVFRHDTLIKIIESILKDAVYCIADESYSSITTSIQHLQLKTRLYASRSHEF